MELYDPYDPHMMSVVVVVVVVVSVGVAMRIVSREELRERQTGTVCRMFQEDGNLGMMGDRMGTRRGL